MILEDLLEGFEYKLLSGNLKCNINNIVYDSRKAEPGDVFVTFSGSVRDGHEFITDVIKKGVAAVICEKDITDIPGLVEFLTEDTKCDVTFVKTENGREALAYMSAAYFGHPAKSLITIGITGTKGKTTTTYMIRSILESAGIPTGLIGTVETVMGDIHIPSANTTPESYVVQTYFRQMADMGIKAVVMEVSSQGLMLSRVSGFTFDYGVFTNLEPDHIGDNEHKDFADYMYWKSTLFRKCKVGIVNADCEHLGGVLKGHTCDIETFGIEKEAGVRAENVRFVQKNGLLETSYSIAGEEDYEIFLNMPGLFSVYNSLTAIALCRHFKVPKQKVQKALLSVNVPGRTEIVQCSKLIPGAPNYTVMIDYAHNAMALSSLLTTLKAYSPKRIVCLFGCGGNRAKSRRYEMGEVSSRLADFTVVTSDNPRDEEPEDIIFDILKGVQKANGEYVTIADRREAVKYAISNAKEGDIIVLAGKGHEDYQEIKGVKHHMDEHELVNDAINSLK